MQIYKPSCMGLLRWIWVGCICCMYQVQNHHQSLHPLNQLKNIYNYKPSHIIFLKFSRITKMGIIKTTYPPFPPPPLVLAAPVYPLLGTPACCAKYAISSVKKTMCHQDQYFLIVINPIFSFYTIIFRIYQHFSFLFRLSWQLLLQASPFPLYILVRLPSSSRQYIVFYRTRSPEQAVTIGKPIKYLQFNGHTLPS